MGGNLGAKVSFGRRLDELLAEGNCASASECGEEAGEQNLDSMNENRVESHGITDKLAADSEVRKGSKQSHVNAARVRGKLPRLIRGGLSMRAEVSRGHSSRWSNDHPGQMGKPIYRACTERSRSGEGPNGQGVEQKGV